MNSSLSQAVIYSFYSSPDKAKQGWRNYHGLLTLVAIEQIEQLRGCGTPIRPSMPSMAA